jgi:Pentapeptide repeats (8 copies)
MLRAIPRGAWWALAGAGFVTLLLLVVLWFPILIQPDLSDAQRHQLAQSPEKLVKAEDDRSNAQNSVRTTLLQGIAGVALLTGAYFAYRGLEAGRLQLKATEDGQITTRYTEAVKQLGDKHNADIRIGGIYALKRIAGDSDRDRPAVVALVSAFVRRSVPVRADERPPDGMPLWAQAPDVAIALEVLAALDRAHLHSMSLKGPPNLHSADLRRADLAFANLTGADLRYSRLQGANLYSANLHSADLRHANLQGANLKRVHLSGANFSRADLSGADLVDAYGDGADFTMATGAYPRDVRSPGEPVRDRDDDGADDGPK